MPLTEDYTFKLGDSGVVLNTSPSLPFVDITKVVGLSSTPYRETERQHEGMDGAFMDAEYEQGRHVILEGTIYASTGSMETYLDTLKGNFAPVRTPIPFYLKAPGLAERLLVVKPLGMRYDWDAFRRIGAADCQFLMFAEDPRIYTAEEQTTNVDVNFPDDTTGFDFGAVGTIGGNQGLVLPGSSGDYASTPDNAVLRITGDIELRAHIRPDAWVGAFQMIVGRYVASNISYRLMLTNLGQLRLSWSSNGTTLINVEATELPESRADSTGTLAVAATLDVDNGASGYTVRFYTASTVHGPWQQLGDDVVGGATTSIFAGTSAMEVGSRDSGTANLFVGSIYEVQVRDGIGGTIVASPNFVAQANGAASFADNVGRTWTMNGNSDIVTPTSTLGFSFDFGFGIPIIGNGEDIIVGGNRPTPPVLTITAVDGPCINPRITNHTQDRRLRLEMTLETGDFVRLYPHTRRVMLNDVSNRRSALVEDEWFFLEPGSNFIGFQSDSADSSVLSVTYRDAWR